MVLLQRPQHATPVDIIDSVDDALLTSGDDFGFSEMTSVYE